MFGFLMHLSLSCTWAFLSDLHLDVNEELVAVRFLSCWLRLVGSKEQQEAPIMAGSIHQEGPSSDSFWEECNSSQLKQIQAQDQLPNLWLCKQGIPGMFAFAVQRVKAATLPYWRWGDFWIKFQFPQTSAWLALQWVSGFFYSLSLRKSCAVFPTWQEHLAGLEWPHALACPSSLGIMLYAPWPLRYCTLSTSLKAASLPAPWARTPLWPSLLLLAHLCQFTFPNCPNDSPGSMFLHLTCMHHFPCLGCQALINIQELLYRDKGILLT